MPKTYSAASADLLKRIERMQAEHHPDLAKVTIGALFTFDSEKSESVLKHQGYAAAAVVRITPLKDRALGLADALIVVDRTHWQKLSAAQMNALIDHELEHLTTVIDEETGKPKFDGMDRPKLQMRRHDHQLGWFDVVARRHGEASPEICQARQLLEQTKQLYFDFGQVIAARSAPEQKAVKQRGGTRVGAH
jgi:hypothetical protein